MISLLHSPNGEKSASDDGMLVRFSGSSVTLDEETTLHIQDQLLALAEQPNQHSFVLDFSNVEYLSSLALGTLVRLHKKLLAIDRRLKIVNLSPRIHEVFTVTRLDQLLDLKLQGPDQRPIGVLVADDEAAIRSVLQVVLRREGCEVWTAENGRQAIELYQRHRDRIAVVLLDVRMPGLDGPATLAELQRCCPHVCCCFITGDSRPCTEEELLATGAVRVLRKPFAFDVIINTIGQLARRALQSRPERWIEISLEECADEAELAFHVGGEPSHPACGSGNPTTSQTADSTRYNLP